MAIDNDRWRVISPWLGRALELSVEERGEWLASLRKKDPAVAAEIDTLLEQAATVESSPSLLDDERPLVLLFLRRYVAYCACRRRFAQMEGAPRLYRSVDRSA